MDNFRILGDDKKWLRFIKNHDGTYSIEIKRLFRKWQKITFGPYGPYPVGYRNFHSFEVAAELYEDCLKRNKSSIIHYMR